MNIIEGAKALKEGKRVRCRSWVPWAYCYALDTGQIAMHTGTSAKDADDIFKWYSYEASVDDLLANNWELTEGV